MPNLDISSSEGQSGHLCSLESLTRVFSLTFCLVRQRDRGEIEISIEGINVIMSSQQENHNQSVGILWHLHLMQVPVRLFIQCCEFHKCHYGFYHLHVCRLCNVCSDEWFRPTRALRENHIILCFRGWNAINKRNCIVLGQ